MGIRSWINERRRKADEEAIEAANEMDDETPEEREYMKGHLESMEADTMAARGLNMGSMDDIERRN